MISVSMSSATYHSNLDSRSSFSNCHTLAQDNRSSENNPSGLESGKICNANLNAAIASSLHIRENQNSHDVSMEFLNRNISFHNCPNASFDTMIKGRINKIPNSIILTNDMDNKGTKVSQVLFSDSELLKCCQQSQCALPRSNLGFHNAGNTCYLNSVLQCFLATGALLNYVREKHGSRKFCSYLNGKLANGLQRFCALCGICRLIEEHDQKNFSGQGLPGFFNRISSGQLVPSYFVSNVRAVCPNLRPYQQEDAHEYLLGVLSRMEESVLAAHGKIPRSTVDTNVIRRIFGGTTRSEVTCSTCRKTSPRNDHWFNLSMDITHSKSLQQCLFNYTQPEVLQGANAYKCETCKQLRHASRCCRIFRAPPILVIQFNRFSRNQKLDNHVDFPSSFNLRPHMTVPSGSPVSYQLYATLNHEGFSCRSGHYVAFTRRKNQWLSHNDSMVTSTTLEHVLRQSPYLLFYELTSFEQFMPVSETKHVDPLATNPRTPSNPTFPAKHVFQTAKENGTKSLDSVPCAPSYPPSSSAYGSISPNVPMDSSRQNLPFCPRILCKSSPMVASAQSQSPAASRPVTSTAIPAYMARLDELVKSPAIDSSEMRQASLPTVMSTKVQDPNSIRIPEGNHTSKPVSTGVHRSRLPSQSSSSSADSVVWVPVTRDDLISGSAPDSFSLSRKRKHSSHRNFSSYEKKANSLQQWEHRRHRHKRSKHKWRKSNKNNHNF